MKFFVILPQQYVLVNMRWYGMFAIMIPVYGFLFLPARTAIAGDTRDFLERTTKPSGASWCACIA